MKLELKHLAPYLPYGLKCEILNYQNDYVNEQHGTCNGYYISGGLTYYTFKSRDVAGKTNDLIKPILRPLSDLTKEIEVNGEKFVPVDEILKWCKLYWDENRNINPLRDWRYKDIQKILEWHFDVFGLIDAGLAIDINTLEKWKLKK